MEWLFLILFILLAGWVWLRGLPQLTAEADRRARINVASRYANEEPRREDEDDTQFVRRVHRRVLETLGLPPIKVVRTWIKHKKLIMLPHSDDVLRYIEEREGKRLASGRFDRRITNGEGAELAHVLKQLGR